MGGVLCCVRQQQPHKNENAHHGSSAAADKKKYREQMKNSSDRYLKKVEWRTLEECFQASPNLNAHPGILGGEVQMFKHLPKKVHPSSSPEDKSQEFFTPRRSFSTESRLGKIDEGEEHDENLASLTPSSRTGSGKLTKKVSFRLPGEADIFVYYSPKETFEQA